MTTEVFNNLVSELKNLNELITNGQNFIQDEDKFNTLDDLNKDLLVAQLHAMSAYGCLLSIRCHLNVPEEIKNEINDMKQDAENRKEIPDA